MSVYQQQYYQYPYYQYASQYQPVAIPGHGHMPVGQAPQVIPQNNFYSQYVNNSAAMQVPFYYYNNIGEKKSKLLTTWTAKEDKLLRELKENQKLGWRDISTFFNDRTPNACQFRWRRIILSINKELGSDSRLLLVLLALSSIVGSPQINKKSHHSINYILN